MDRKKMTFSPSELALFVDLIGKSKGARASLDYLEKVDPGLDKCDIHAKNWPAYAIIMQRVKDIDSKSMARRLVLLTYRNRV